MYCAAGAITNLTHLCRTGIRDLLQVLEVHVESLSRCPAMSLQQDTSQLAQHALARFGLVGSNALVTGGSRGIGRAICTELASLGARVSLKSPLRQVTSDHLMASCLAAASQTERLQVCRGHMPLRDDDLRCWKDRVYEDSRQCCSCVIKIWRLVVHRPMATSLRAWLLLRC